MVAKKPVLRAVTPGETPVVPRILTLAEAIESGSHLDILRAQRRDIVKSIPETKGAPLAALHGQLAKLSTEIAALEAKEADDSEGGANVEDEEFDAEAV